MTIKIVNLLPELLGTYGDQGNVTTLSWRLTQRGIANQVVQASAYEKLPNDGDFYFLGGGEDDAQIAAAELLQSQNTLTNALANGAQIFAVCAGFQILGENFPASGNRIIAGLGILPITTQSAQSENQQSENQRCVGELLTESLSEIGTLTGFENHGGQTLFLEKLSPLGIVKRGIGNHTKEASDGAITDQVIATYMHGPALVRNPKLADFLLSRKLGLLEPIKTSAESTFNELHEACVARAIR